MAIVSVPKYLRNAGHIECAICHRVIPLSQATAGRVTLDGFQAFACNGHFWNGNEYITGWADFISDQRFEMLHRGTEPGWQIVGGYTIGTPMVPGYEGDGDGWTLF